MSLPAGNVDNLEDYAEVLREGGNTRFYPSHEKYHAVVLKGMGIISDTL